MSRSAVPVGWSEARGPSDAWYVRHPSEWIEVHPRSPSASFAAEAADRRLLFEVSSHVVEAHRADLADWATEILLRSVEEDADGFRLEEIAPLDLTALRDDRLPAARALAEGFERPEAVRRMRCHLVDGIPCRQESYTLVRGVAVVFLNFRFATECLDALATVLPFVARSAWMRGPGQAVPPSETS